MSIKTIIQAGGKGTRLLPYTYVLPKPLMPVGEFPVLEIIIRQLAFYGLKDIVITVGHLGSIIQAFFQDGAKWGVNIDYCFERKPLGTIGPLKSIEGLNSPFIVMNGDILTDLDYNLLYANHIVSSVDITIATFKKRVPVSLGVLDLDEKGCLKNFREKPIFHYYASMGIYVMNPNVLDCIPHNSYFGFDDLMRSVLCNSLRVKTFIHEGIWYDIGTPEDYNIATAEFSRNRDRLLIKRS